MIVYLLMNTINGKQYVGKTVRSLGARWRAHLSQARQQEDTHLHRAIRKYGAEAFRYSVLSAALNTVVLSQLETFWIRELRTRSPRGYNLTDGGEGCFGYTHAPAAIAKMRQKRSPESCANIRAAANRPEHKARIAEVNRNGTNWLGKHHCQETIIKKRLIASRPENRAAVSRTHLGRKKSLETRAKMSASRRNFLAALDPQEKRARALRGWVTRRANVA